AARAALPPSVAHGDAAFNLGRMALLVAGLADHRRLAPEAAHDRLHQPYRAALFPESSALIDGLVSAGALCACWSGAGPSILAVCTSASAPAVQSAGEALLRGLAVPGRCLQVAADTAGLVVAG
ncbi:MAG: homoserine kinase, partial [Acidimicrobiales bacterium]